MRLPSLSRSLNLLLLVISSPLHSLAFHPRSYKPLSEDLLTNLVSLSSDSNPSTSSLVNPKYPTTSSIIDYKIPSSFLSKILIPRPAGSKNLAFVQDELVEQFKSLSSNKSWTLEEDIFEASTPVGNKRMRNLIFTHDSTASRFLVLAAHIDSKYFPNPPEDQFVGATDSAAPVAILVDVATSLNDWLEEKRMRKWEKMERGEWVEGGDEDESLKIVILDGEEAFEAWTHTDSIYGARHLAEKWSEPLFTPSASLAPQTSLSQISTFVLLDLLGAKSPTIRSYYPNTDWLFRSLATAEDRLGKAGLLWDGVSGEGWKVDGLVTNKWSTGRSFFKVSDRIAYGGGIEDDHLPFLHAGVPILHLIASPFPPVWHTLADNADALDLPTIKAWAYVMRLMTAEYLGLKSGEYVVRHDELVSFV